MYITQTNNIRRLSKEEYGKLRLMCRFSNNLYNVALYSMRQHYFAEKRFLNYESNYHVCKGNENYKLLQAGVAQQTLRVADRSFKSFFNLVRKAKAGDYRFHDISMPHYKKKGGLAALVLSGNAIAISNGTMKVPVSREFERRYGKTDIRIPFPARLEGKKVKEARILPCGGGRHFKVQYVFVQEVEDMGPGPDRTLAIDIGVDNLCACVTDTGASFLIDGRGIKSINRYWNKRKAHYQSIADRQGMKRTGMLYGLAEKRNNRVDDAIRKAARYIVDYCIANDIGTIVCGYSADFKRGSRMGKASNQAFVCIPHGKLRTALSCLCERYGMAYIEQEESYTSKASFIDGDDLPVYRPEQPCTGTFSGKRVKRGLYRTGGGMLVNADINAAANILRKSKRNLDFEGLCKGLLASPRRIRLA